MKKYEAIGVIETKYFTFAMEFLDAMSKTAHIEFLTSEKYLGGRLVSLIFGGSVSDVQTAIEVVKETAGLKQENPLKMAIMITNPHPEIMRYIVTHKVVEPKKKKKK